MDFTIRIVNTVITIHSIYNKAYYICRNYWVQDSDCADINITITTLDIINQERIARKTNDTKNCEFSLAPDELEVNAIHRKLCAVMIQKNILLMHGSVLGYKNRAYMITAPSGTGKTTMTRNLLFHMPGSFVINGDKPFVQIGLEKAIAWGTPWCGKERLNRNCGLPLAAVFVLERGANNSICRLDASQIIPSLIHQCYKGERGDKVIRTCQLLSGLIRVVPVYKVIVAYSEHKSDLNVSNIERIIHSD